MNELAEDGYPKIPKPSASHTVGSFMLVTFIDAFMSNLTQLVFCVNAEHIQSGKNSDQIQVNIFISVTLKSRITYFLLRFG